LTEKFQPKGCVTELDFGYNTKIEVYANSSSDIPMSYKIALHKSLLFGDNLNEKEYIIARR
jgi:hypothetical protein